MFQNRNNLYPATPFSQTRGLQRPPGAPKMLPILLPDLSPRLTLDEDRVGSPEFRHALQAAKQNRSVRQNPEVPFLASNPLDQHIPLSKTQEIPAVDRTKRMQTRVAVCEPHHFQVVPLREVKKFSVTVRPHTASGPLRHAFDVRQKPPTPSTATSDNTPCIPPLTEETLLLSRKPSVSKAVTVSKGRRSTIYVAAESAPRLRHETSSPARLAYRTRSLSTSSSLGNENKFTTSNSLQDIQTRAASSTKHRRRTQTISLTATATSPTGSVYSHKSLTRFTTSDSRMAIDKDGNAKRRVTYTGSMDLNPTTLERSNLDGPAVSVVPEYFASKPSPTCSSVISQAGDVEPLDPRPPQMNGNPAKKVTTRRTPLASLDLNLKTRLEPVSNIHHISMRAFSTSRHTASFLSTDPFAASSPTIRRAPQSQTVYHPIVMDLLALVDAAIVEWSDDF